eukprot:SAG22_NODE_5_length_41775_cov_111.520971_4_plen_305_part_00
MGLLDSPTFSLPPNPFGGDHSFAPDASLEQMPSGDGDGAAEGRAPTPRPGARGARGGPTPRGRSVSQSELSADGKSDPGAAAEADAAASSPPPPAAAAAAAARTPTPLRERGACAHGLGDFERCASVPSGLLHVPTPAKRIGQPSTLWSVVKQGRPLSEIRKMLSDGHDPNSAREASPAGVLASQPGRRTPLHYAAIYGRLEMAEMLLAGGANPNARDKAGWQPLHYGVLNGRASKLAMVRALLRGKADPRSVVHCPIHSTANLGPGPKVENLPQFARRHGQFEVADLLQAFLEDPAGALDDEE